MKKIIFTLLIITTFSSCRINEPESPSDYTHPGKVMYDMSIQNIYFYSNLLDKALKINTYIQSNATEKIQIEDKYFEKYKIRANDTEYFLIAAGDTIYTINTFNNNLQLLNDSFAICRTRLDTIVIKNTGSNQWEINCKNKNLTSLTFNTSLKFKCTDSNPIESFEDANFEIVGNSEFKHFIKYQQTKFRFETIEPIIHQANMPFYVYKSGKFQLNAVNETDNQSESSQATFNSNDSNTNNILILYRTRKKTYSEHYYMSDYDTDMFY